MMALVFLLLLLPVAVLSVPVENKSLPVENESLPVDCEDVYNEGSIHSGVYTIFPAGHDTPVQVYCDMGCEDDDGGKWTVIQRRMDGTVNFYRPWIHYKDGFGNKTGEYWLGLENIFLLTWTKKYELRVDMEDFEKGRVHALYSSFSVDPESEGYRLHVSGYNDGGAGDSMSYHNEMKFSTFDNDQDQSYSNCATTQYGGFWYNNCHYANPNGVYTWGGTGSNAHSVIWSNWKGYYYSLKSITMKIRPLSLPDE
ncbi:hypothetical protein AAFF_G00200060 [Aldrovandia affinis]|uniref:Fibrinogen C-terminal domain-containing protein n=1 Tax=Aldrovandia affinis TaxID=143900 RepID=A0AAD7W6H9_9TELE|nr:hypothetical protein AAFF_G00200060 [Aldrovandia affinis]